MARQFQLWGKIQAGIIGIAALAATVAFTPAQAHSGHYLYVLDNPNGQNAISTYWLASSGHLSYIATTGIGGTGTGVGDLGSQGALQVGPNRRELFAVDASSNQVSMVRINGSHLTLVATFASGGVMPISLTFAHNRLYVANAGDATHAANIANFVLHGDAAPTWVSDTPLSVAAAGPAQVAASPDGAVLVVTEKHTNRIDTFRIHSDGSLGDITTRTSAGATPFGFAFNPQHDDQLSSRTRKVARRTFPPSRYMTWKASPPMTPAGLTPTTRRRRAGSS
jgi:6-phosphogluconolactonase (cycloisomerase 2 family)